MIFFSFVFVCFFSRWFVINGLKNFYFLVSLDKKGFGNRSYRGKKRGRRKEYFGRRGRFERRRGGEGGGLGCSVFGCRGRRCGFFGAVGDGGGRVWKDSWLL